MKELVFRDIETGDLPQVKKMIDDTWGFSELFENEAALDAALGLYFNQVLYAASFAKAAILDGKLCGLAAGHADGQPPKFRMLLEDPAEHIAALLSMVEYERQNINEFMTKLETAYSALLEGRESRYDGTLDFLIVPEAARGLNIGGKLWGEIKTYFEENGARSIYVFTDSDCNFGFYDHQGFSRAGEEQITYTFACGNTQWSLNVAVYLYEYKLGG